jgi:2-dehydro-3-deoxygalactonokinase
MAHKVITIDTGTTNTRVTFWSDGIAQHHAARQVGVRDTAINGSVAVLRNGVKSTIVEVLETAGVSLDQIDLVLASGMITSNVGLVDIPHLLAPAGIIELAAGMRRVEMPEVCGKPIWFVPGIRNMQTEIGLHNCEAMDMMRGEEVETIALIERLGLVQPAALILPGSHSKVVVVDERQRITGCVTTLSGELMHVITHHTILANSLENDFAHQIDEEMLLAGARSAGRVGLGRAAFTVRTLSLFSTYDRNACANFLLGAVLGADLLTLKNSSAITISPSIQVVITGKPLLREALALLVKDDDFFSGPVRVTSDSEQADLAGTGVLAIARTRGLLA